MAPAKVTAKKAVLPRFCARMTLGTSCYVRAVQLETIAAQLLDHANEPLDRIGFPLRLGRDIHRQCKQTRRKLFDSCRIPDSETLASLCAGRATGGTGGM